MSKKPVIAIDGFSSTGKSSISKEIAKNISSIYPSLSILLKTLNDSDDKIGLLMKIDKIGKTKAITIINYLL